MTFTARSTVVLVCFLLIAGACTRSDESSTSTSPVPGVTVGLPTATPPSPPPIVPLLRSTGSGDLVFGQNVALTSQVLAAEPIARLELWVDGANAATQNLAEPMVDPVFPWQWTADSVGLHTIVVRAYDASGRVAESTPSWFRVNPGWDVVTGLPLEGLPVSPLESASNGVAINSSSCTATVTVPAAPNMLGQQVVGTTFGVGRFQAIDVLGADGGEVTVPMTSSPVIVSVEPYDDFATVSGVPIVIPGAPECSSGAWAGDVVLDGTVLQRDDELEVAYLYVAEDGSGWRRIPESGFVPAGAGGFDFSGLLPPVDAEGHLDVEAWGWADGRLVGLGRGRYESGGGPAPIDPLWGSAQPVTPYSSLNIVRLVSVLDTSDVAERLLLEDVVCASGSSAICGTSTPTLRWDTALLGAEAGLIQVSATRPPTGPSINFPGLLWSQMIAMDGDPVRDFELAITDIREGTAPSGGARAGGGSFGFSDLEVMGVELSEVAEPAPPGASPRTSQPFTGTWWQGAPPSRLWVQVIPFVNGRPTDGVSNTVLFEIEGSEILVEPPPEQVFDALYDVEVDFTHPSISNESFAHCVRVISNPFGSGNPAPVPSLQYAYDGVRDSARVFTDQGSEPQGIVPGATVCAFKPDPPDKDVFDYVGEAISFIGEAWDTFKDLVDMVKSGIIQGIVDITGCQPEATCVAALTALADAGLASIGVPPTMPSFGELMEAAKGDIAAALTKALVGQVCDGPCADFAEKFVKDAIDDIEEHFSGLATAQAQSGGWVLFLNPEIRVIPEPAGQLFPGSFRARITRKENGQVIGSQMPGFCSVGLVTEGTGPLSWTSKQGEPHDNENVTGPVFAREDITVDLAELGPGESITVGVASLDFDRSLYLKGTSPALTGYASQERLQSIELWTDFDTRFKMLAHVCGKSFSENVDRGIADSPAEISTP